ncbi:MAG: DUF1398 family protein [Chitinophagaceae bacterium]
MFSTSKYDLAETFVSDGHTDYYGADHHEISTTAKYDTLRITDMPNAEQIKADRKDHQQGETDCLTFCNDCATSDIEKWAINIDKITCIYHDKAGNKILLEGIAQ